MTLDEFFGDQLESRQLFEAVQRVIEALGPLEIRVGKSEVAFRRGKTFARLWMPGQYLKREAAPLVLTLGFPERDPSPRWKQVVEPAPGHFTHHLELHSPADIDDEVRAWLAAAWAAAS